MNAKYQTYRQVKYQPPEKTWAWNLYGAGMENLGKDGEPELLPVPEPASDQLLVRMTSPSFLSSMKFLTLRSQDQRSTWVKTSRGVRRLGADNGRQGVKVSFSERYAARPSAPLRDTRCKLNAKRRPSRTAGAQIGPAPT